MNKNAKRFLTGFFSLMIIFSSAPSIPTYAAKIDFSIVYEKYVNLVDHLSQQDFIDAGNALSNEPNFEVMSEEKRNAYIMKFIVDKYNPKQTSESQVSTYSYSSPPTSYGYLNTAEQALASAHPFQASQYYISSQAAINYTNQKFGYSGFQDKSDAFRHACWNAILTMRIGSSAAKSWTNAHESTSSGIDKQMDLFNNALGRSICVSSGYESLSSGQAYATPALANKVYSAIKAGQGRIIVNGSLVSSAF